MAEKIFASGLIVKRHENAPEFVVCKLSFKVEEFRAWLMQHQNNEWVNVSVHKSKEGKYYAELDTWKPDNKKTETPVKSSPSVAYPEEELDPEDIPF